MEKSKNYEETLKRMLAERTGGFPRFLGPSIDITAKTWEMFDKVHAELMDMVSLTKEMKGSKEQTKEEVTPLLSYYIQLQKLLLVNFEALGLNFKTSPKKMTEPTEICAKGDPIDQMLEGLP